MPLDAMVLTALRRELAPALTDAKIDRISMPERDLLVLSVHSRRLGSKRLLLSARPGTARIQFTEQTLENPPQPFMFCMLLRKHLLGARITGIQQPVGERLILLHMDTVDELSFHASMTLVLELMGKGVNLLLVGQDGRIVDCLRRVDYEDGARRALLPGLFYTLPPEQDRPSFFRTSPEETSRLIAGADRSMDPDRWLLDTFGGLSPFLCRELSADGWEGLEENTSQLRSRLEREDFTPVLLSVNGSPKDFTFQPVRQYGDAVEQTVFPDFSALLDAYYARREAGEIIRRRFAELTRTVKTALSRLERKIAAQEQELLATEKREEYRRRGDLITANIYRLERGMGSFETQDYYQEDCPVVTIPLDRRKTPQQNAAQNYKLYNKAKTANRILIGLLAQAREEAAYLESVLHELSLAESQRDLSDIRAELLETGYLRQKPSAKRQKKPPARGPMRFISDSGTEILVGRGNVQNDELTFRTARRGDLWLHVQKIPGSHVIVSQANCPADEITVAQAAALAVTFSQAKDGGKAAVDVTLARNVKKPSGARPGRVIYTDHKTLIAQADPALAERLQAPNTNFQ